MKKLLALYRHKFFCLCHVTAKVCLVISFSLLSYLSDGQYTNLYNFTGVSGAEPFGSLILSGNTLFGTAYLGGSHDSGCIFSIDTNGNNYKDLLDFNGTNGINPNSPLTLSGGTLFGTA